MAQDDRVLVARGVGTVKTIQFWRLAWEALAADTRARRFMIATLGGRGRHVFVASAQEFREVVMVGPRADYMESDSWKGTTRWAEDDPWPGGSYLMDYRASPVEPVLERLRPFVRRREQVVAEWGPEVDLVVMSSIGAERPRRTITSLALG
jgi:hypothetical protein